MRRSHSQGQVRRGRSEPGLFLVILLPDGMNLNQELVKQGGCWWYRKYAPGDTVPEGLETEAREARRGL